VEGSAAKIIEKLRIGMTECNIKQDGKYINRQAFNYNRTNKKASKGKKVLPPDILRVFAALRGK